MKIKTVVFWSVLFILLLSFSSCYYDTAPSEIINISPINDSTVFSDEVIFKWKLGNFANGVSYDFYLGNDLNNLQLIQSNLSSGKYSKDGLDKFKSYFWKITAKNSFGECESNIFSFMVCDEIPKNPSPINYSTSVPTSTALSWECFCPEDSTLTYNIYLSDNNNPSLIKENCSLNSYKPEMLFSGTEYTWKVVAIDGDNKYESEIWSFETIPDPGNTPPEAPTLTNPVNDSTDQPVDISLEWNCTDPNGDSLVYDLYFGKNTDPQFFTNNINANTFNINDLDKGTKYYWKVLAKDGRGGRTYSATYNFKTIEDPDNTPPTEPSAPTPSDNSTDQPTDTTLSWECSDPDGDSLAYDVYFGDNTNPSLVSNEQTGNDYGPGELNAGTTYYWKIVAKDGRGGVTAGAKWKFETVPDPDNTPPTEPGTPTPLNNATDQPTDTTLSWECSDPDGDTLKYDVYFGNNANPPLVNFEQEADTYDPGELNTGTTYYWKIVAKDGRGGVTEGAKWNFETVPDPDNTPPTEPGTPTPLNGATDQPTDTTLSWKCSDPDEDSLKYDIYFGDNSNPPLVSFEQLNDNYDPGELNAGTTYCWKIVAKDGRGGVTEGDKWNFETIPNSELPTPENPNPLNDQTDVIWDSVTLAWDISGNSDGLYYDIYFGKDEIPGIYRIGHAATEITISNLERDQKYYWQIVVTDEPYSREAIADGSNELLEEIAIVRRDSAVKIGEIWNFTTKKNSPPELVSIYPTDGATNVFITESASWIFTDPDGDTLTYDLYFDNDRNPKNIAVNISISTYSPFMYGMEKYYWKIVAKDNYGGICESNTFEFTTNLIQWQKCLGGSAPDYGYSIQQTSDGGYIVAGYTRSNDGNVTDNHGDYDYWIVKLNSLGNIIWQKCLGGSSRDEAYSIQQTSDGGYIVAGYSSSNDGDVSGNNGYRDYWIVKLNSLGNIIWQKCLGGSSRDEAYSIQQTSDGGYIVAGFTQSNDSGDVSGNNGYRDYWIVKLEDLGNDATITWQKCLGGSDADYAKSIQQTSDGGYIVAGYTESNDSGNVSENHGWNDYWIVKLEDLGNDATITWQKCLGGSSWDEAYSIQQTSDDGYIVAGKTNSNDGDISGDNHGNWDYWIVKLNSLGTIIWQKCLGGSEWDVAHSIQQTSDGGYIVAGYTWSNDGDVSENHGNLDYWIVKLNSLGNIIWQKCLGGSSRDEAYSIQQTSDGGYIVAGFTESNDSGDISGDNHENWDYWIVKTAPVR